MCFPKNEEPVNLSEQPIQLAPEIHSWSPESHLHRCVVFCCLCIPERERHPLLPSSPPLSLLPSLLHSLDNTTRSWQSDAGLSECAETDNKAESEIISHLRLILFKEKESSKALACTDTEAGARERTRVRVRLRSE